MSTTDDFDILDWIESGTVAERSVVIYNDPALVGEFERLDRELKAAEQAKKAGAAEESVGEADPVAVIIARMKDLHARWEASKATWWVRALPAEDIKAIARQFPDPPRPDFPKDTPTEQRAAEYQAWADAAAAATDDRNLRYLEKAVFKIETPRGTAKGITLDALRKIKSRAHGTPTLNRLIKALEQAQDGDVEIPAPNSRSSSEGTQA